MIKKIRKRGKLERRLVLSMLLIFLIVFISTCVTIFIAFTGEAVVDERAKLLSYAANLPEYLGKFVSAEELEKMTDEELNEAVNKMYDYGGFIDNWLENGADDHYYESRASLAIVRSNGELSDVFIYKAARDENGELVNDMTVVMNVSIYPWESYKLGEEFGPSEAFETIKSVYDTGESEAYNYIVRKNNELLLLVYVPLKYEDGTVCAVMGVEKDLTDVFVTMITDYNIIIIDAVINFLIFAAVVFIIVKRRVVKPVGIISSHMNRFVSKEGELHYEPITEIHTNDEIEQIAEDFNSLAHRTIDYTKNLEIKTTEEERLRVDLDVASQIRNVISSESRYPAFPERTDFDLCASLNYTMYNRCSFCNYFFTDTDHLFIVAGEPLGNSLASMIFSVLAVSYIKSFAKLGYEPYKIAMETNNELCSIEKNDASLTVGVIIVDIELKTGSMKYVNAGMPPMLIKKPGENYTLDKPDKPFSLGQMRGVSFEQNTIQLYQGSTVMLTSFGVTEMCDPKGQKYGFERLTDVVNRISGNVYDLDKTIKQLEDDLNKFREDSPVSLDTMILGFRYFG